MTREIQLTQGQVALVDDEDYEWLSGYRWFVIRRKNGKFHAARQKRIYKYGRVPGSRGNGRNSDYSNVYMHQDIMGTPPEGKTIDHEDRNGLNNQRHNLRFITFSENTINSEAYSKGSVEKHGNKYRVRIKREGVRITIGSYETEWDAQQALKDFICQA